MIYGSFGKPVARAEIWPEISGRSRAGTIASLTHRMVADAMARGFAAVAVQARHPLQVLRVCKEAGIRVILNHRLTHDTAAGHYSVMVDIDDKDVILHDPYYGPARRVPHADLLELWQPQSANSEVLGYVLIALAAQPSPAAACWLCQKPLLPEVVCPHCTQAVKLQPNALLGCMDTTCIVRMWNYVCCPACDCGFTVTTSKAAPSVVVAESAPATEAAAPGAAPDKPAGGAESINLDRFFAEVDKFRNLIANLPAAAGNAALQRQIEALGGLRQSLTLARAEAIANEKLAFSQMAKLTADANKAAEAHQKQVEEIQAPMEPLDGNLLGRALMSNLGFTR